MEKEHYENEQAEAYKGFLEMQKTARQDHENEQAEAYKGFLEMQESELKEKQEKENSSLIYTPELFAEEMQNAKVEHEVITTHYHCRGDGRDESVEDGRKINVNDWDSITEHGALTTTFKTENFNVEVRQIFTKETDDGEVDVVPDNFESKFFFIEPAEGKSIKIVDPEDGGLYEAEDHDVWNAIESKGIMDFDYEAILDDTDSNFNKSISLEMFSENIADNADIKHEYEVTFYHCSMNNEKGEEEQYISEKDVDGTKWDNVEARGFIKTQIENSDFSVEVTESFTKQLIEDSEDVRDKNDIEVGSDGLEDHVSISSQYRVVDEYGDTADSRDLEGALNEKSLLNSDYDKILKDVGSNIKTEKKIDFEESFTTEKGTNVKIGVESYDLHDMKQSGDYTFYSTTVDLKVDIDGEKQDFTVMNGMDYVNRDFSKPENDFSMPYGDNEYPYGNERIEEIMSSLDEDKTQENADNREIAGFIENYVSELDVKEVLANDPRMQGEDEAESRLADVSDAYNQSNSADTEERSI